jgi:hypothetical protein
MSTIEELLADFDSTTDPREHERLTREAVRNGWYEEMVTRLTNKGLGYE